MAGPVHVCEFGLDSWLETVGRIGDLVVEGPVWLVGPHLFMCVSLGWTLDLKLLAVLVT